MIEEYGPAKGCHSNILSVLASYTLMKVLSSKRFVKAVAAGQPPPANLVTNLAEAMQTCRDMSLSVPGDLQARALKFCHNKAR